MSTKRESDLPADRGGISSGAALFGRLLWFAIGPLALMFLTIGIVSSRSGWLTLLDGAFAVVVALIVWGRWKEQRSGRATLTTGEPARWEDFHRYVRVLVPVAAGIWVVANVLGNHVLGWAE